MFDFPTDQQWQEAEAAYPWETLSPPPGVSAYLMNRRPMRDWELHLRNRIGRVLISYTLLTFHFQKGIPDDEWFLSPGRNGESVEYFPHFTDADRWNKLGFDYHADAFFSNLFSAWDTLAHLLNEAYHLSLDKPDFSKVRKSRKLKEAAPAFYASVEALAGSSSYVASVRMRNDITHNFLPGVVDSTYKVERRNGIVVRASAGIGEYVTARQTVETATGAVDVFAAALGLSYQAISERIPERGM